ncbi:hypothetical protein [Vibrio mediterranei]|uniref:hypothetical protein n=1 Tax=Vibrio mediterranei TaxID=689 RepID=UPI0040683F4C
MQIRNQMAWRAFISNLRAYYIHNVFHDHKNIFGKGLPSDRVMTMVKALDRGLDIKALINDVHQSGDGVAFVNEVETQMILEKMEEALVNEY